IQFPCIYYHLICCQPRPTLFPYTTLFRSHHVMREYIVNPLHLMRVAEVMEKDVPTVPASLPVDGLFQRLADEDPVMARRQEWVRSEEHTSELQSRSDLVCRLLLEKKKIIA